MKKLIFIFVTTFLLYLAVTYVSAPFSNFDTKSYNVIGVLTLNGKSAYPDPAISRHPYLPLFLYFEAITLSISSFLKIPQIMLIKIILSFFHLLSVYTVYLLSKRNIRTTLLYALNPVSLLIIAFHGQFDIIPLSLILFSIFLLKEKKYVAIMILLGLAFSLKTWPILFIAPFLKRIPKKFWVWFLLPPFFTVFLYSIFFHTSLFEMARVLAVYQGVPGIWGFGKVLSLISTSKLVLLIYKFIFVIGLLIYSFKQKKALIKEELFALLFLFFIFTPGFGIQWFLWLIPFLFLTKKPFIYLFMTAITLCLSVAYSSWPPFIMVSPQIVNATLFPIWPLFIIYFFLFSILIPHSYKSHSHIEY